MIMFPFELCFTRKPHCLVANVDRGMNLPPLKIDFESAAAAYFENTLKVCCFVKHLT